MRALPSIEVANCCNLSFQGNFPLDNWNLLAGGGLDGLVIMSSSGFPCAMSAALFTSEDLESAKAEAMAFVDVGLVGGLSEEVCWFLTLHATPYSQRA